ncbi:uncharacterized protein SOCE836_098710 [Sorangium cellulosum]|uniref:Orc1-like AAA ATPase domain-containing protein n=1 Tax=Sorangium cellulosum TaxID=56 RepID=A0A4P2R4S6_SORCE|nr:uncharacterized protein SOCE836_098710 [Sorangium cellulosum]
MQLQAARQSPVLMGDRLREAFEDFMRAECQRQPVLLVLEDLHWGDLLTVTLIDAALQDARDMPFFVPVLARPEVRELFPALWRTSARASGSASRRCPGARASGSCGRCSATTSAPSRSKSFSRVPRATRSCWRSRSARWPRAGARACPRRRSRWCRRGSRRSASRSAASSDPPSPSPRRRHRKVAKSVDPGFDGWSTGLPRTDPS